MHPTFRKTGRRSAKPHSPCFRRFARGRAPHPLQSRRDSRLHTCWPADPAAAAAPISRAVFQRAGGLLARRGLRALFCRLLRRPHALRAPRIQRRALGRYQFCHGHGPCALKELLQAHAGAVHLPGSGPAHIAVMPGLIADAGDLALLRRVAEDEAVLPAVLHQPFLLRRVLLLLVQDLVAGGHDVQGQAGLVLAGAGRGHPAGGLRLHLVLRHAGGADPGHLVVVQPGLGGLRPVGGADDGREPRLPAVGEHGVQIVIDPRVHLEAVGQGGQLHLIVLRQRVPGVHQQQPPIRPPPGLPGSPLTAGMDRGM